MQDVPSAEDIRFRAYLLWEAAGRPHGHDDDFWHQAVRQLEQESEELMQNAASKDAVEQKPRDPSRAKKKASVKVSAPKSKKTPTSKSDEKQSAVATGVGAKGQRERKSSKATVGEKSKASPGDTVAKPAKTPKRPKKTDTTDGPPNP